MSGRGEKTGKIVAVIPAYNEAKHVAEVVEETRKHVDAVVVVDDGSADATRAVAEEAGALTLRNLVNMGKGFALRLGVEKALTAGADVVVCLDADGQHLPSDIPKMVERLERENLDIVFGSRSLDKAMPFVMRFGNWVIRHATHLLLSIRLRDSQSGFRVFRAAAYPRLRWQSNGYAVESEMVLRAFKAGLRYKEYPIKTLYRDRYKGTSILDGVRIVLNMIWWRLLE